MVAHAHRLLPVLLLHMVDAAGLLHAGGIEPRQYLSDLRAMEKSRLAAARHGMVMLHDWQVVRWQWFLLFGAGQANSWQCLSSVKRAQGNTLCTFGQQRPRRGSTHSHGQRKNYRLRFTSCCAACQRVVSHESIVTRRNRFVSPSQESRQKTGRGEKASGWDWDPPTPCLLQGPAEPPLTESLSSVLTHQPRLSFSFLPTMVHMVHSLL